MSWHDRLGERKGRQLPADLSAEEICSEIDSSFAKTLEGLGRLVRIPSISAPGHDPARVVESADETAAWLQSVGLKGVRRLEVPGAHPAVYGFTPGPAGAPTVLLYAHHDVQPPGPVDLWDSDPFEPTERDGRLFGRGTADDKAGIAAHVAALQIWGGKPPVSVSVYVEGEEEIASQHFPEFLSKYEEELRADIIVLADCSNWTVGTPTLTTSLRGILDFVLEVRTLDHAVHSGSYGGPVPDALTVLCQLIASLHDEKGNVAVPGLQSGPFRDMPISESRIRKSAGVRPGVLLLGTGPLANRLWSRPAVSVLGIDAPHTATAAQQLVPDARARISVRLAPGDGPQRACAAIVAHLHQNNRWGAEIRVIDANEGAPHLVDVSGAAFDAFRRACGQAWGCGPVEPGSGGSLPMVAALAQAFPGAEVLLTGVSDPDSMAHCENESVHLEDLRKCCATEAVLLSHLAALA